MQPNVGLHVKYEDKIALYVLDVIAVNWHLELDHAMK